jgi:hypothetical protein
MRFVLLTATCVVAAFAGCSAVNVADDPNNHTTTATGTSTGGTVGGSGGTETTTTTTTGSGNSGGAGNSGGGGGSGGTGAVEPTCDDELQNGDETDVDCGGSSCDPCATGSGCSVPADCASGFCPADDGVCCVAACDGLCEACAEAKTGVPDGTCSPVLGQSDPDLDCPAAPVSGCGVSGAGCDGSGACLLYAPGTVCQPASCADAVANTAATCNGAGTCVPGQSASCGLFACDPATSACRTTCSTADHCTAPATCNQANGVCQPATVTFDTHNFAGYTEYPLDTDVCGCCGTTTTAQTANAFCVLAGMSSAVDWTTGSVTGTNCYCYDCITVDTWASNCCGGSASRPMILTVTCQ